VDPPDPLEAGLGGRTQPAAGFAQFRLSKRVRALLLVDLVAAAVYVSWWLTPGHVGTPTLFVALAAAEAFNLFHTVGLWWTFWSTDLQPPSERRTAFRVDVLVTTCGEPIHVLAATVKAAVSMHEPHRTVVLDDAGRPEVRSLAGRLGADYLTRGTRRGAKAGNLNHGLDMTDGDLVALFDADHAPRPEFLQEILGYFEDPKVGFVQTPQFYRNARGNAVARGAYDQQAIFYGPICRGKSGLESAFCCGTNVVLRKAAVSSVGGFDERSVVEDFATSIRLHRAGWRSVYYPYLLADGLGPASLRSYFRQQFRWARGSLAALVSLEPFRRGFSMSQRVQYLLATSFYATGLATAIYVVLPILYLIGGWSAFSVGSGDFVLYFAAYFMLGLVTVRTALGGQLRLDHLRYTFGTFPVYAVAGVAALLHVPARFRVTGRSDAEEEGRPPLTAWVTVLAFAATLAAIGLGWFVRPLNAQTFTNMAWGVVNVLLLSGIVGATLGGFPLLRRRFAERRAAPTVVLPPAAGNGAGPRASPALQLPQHWFRAGRRRPVPHLPVLERVALPVAVLTVLGLLLRLLLLGHQSLRLDESISLGLAQGSMTQILDYTIGEDYNPPFFYAILHYWTHLAGTTEWAVRMPSAFLGAAAVPLLYLVGRRLIGSRAALFAAAIGAGSPFWVWHSLDARAYALVLTLVLAALYLLMEAVEKGRFWRWGAYAAVTALSFHAHYFALLMPLVHVTYVVVYTDSRRRVLAWLGGLAGAVLLFVPWALLFYRGHVDSGGVGDLTTGVAAAAPDYGFYAIASTLVIFVSVYVVGYFGAGVLAVITGVVLGAWPLAVLRAAVTPQIVDRLRSPATVFLLVWLALPIAIIFGARAWKPELFFQRYLIAVSPALFLIMGSGISLIVRRRALGLALVFASLAIATTINNMDPGNPAREDFRRAASVIGRDFQQGDAVVVMPDFNTAPFKYYFRDDVAVRGAPDEPDPLASLEAAVEGPGRPGRSIWLVTLYEHTFDRPGRLDRGPGGRFTPAGSRRLGTNLRIRRYRVPSLEAHQRARREDRP